jgi:hypothetical protein
MEAASNMLGNRRKIARLSTSMSHSLVYYFSVVLPHSTGMKTRIAELALPLGLRGRSEHFNENVVIRGEGYGVFELYIVCLPSSTSILIPCFRSRCSAFLAAAEYRVPSKHVALALQTWSRFFPTLSHGESVEVHSPARSA